MLMVKIVFVVSGKYVWFFQGTVDSGYAHAGTMSTSEVSNIS